MRIQRFAARTVPEAMAAVKKGLGSDAVLLETRRIKDAARRAAGELVEVVAAVDRNPGRRRRVIPPVRAKSLEDFGDRREEKRARVRIGDRSRRIVGLCNEERDPIRAEIRVSAADRAKGRQAPDFDTVLARAEAPLGDGDRRVVFDPEAQSRRGDEGLVDRHGRSEADDVASPTKVALPGGQGPSPHPPFADPHPAPPATQATSPDPAASLDTIAHPAIADLEQRLDTVAEAVRQIGAAHAELPVVATVVSSTPAPNELIAITAALIALDRKVDTLVAATQAPQPMAAGEVDPRLLAELAVAGLDSIAARHWGGRLQAAYAERPATAGETPLMRLAEAMGTAITCVPEAGAGEVHALLGSSGAGKSTLVVKLALRAKQLHRIPVHLITLDSARPEGAALLGRYAEVFGLPLTRVSDAAALDTALDRLPPHCLGLVDCPATSVDVEQQPDLAALLRGLARRAVVHLLLPAATALPEMRRQVAAHRTIGLDRLAFTKVDEAASFGQVAAIAAETALPVSWLTTGRQLPEDLTDANLDLLRTLVTRRGTARGGAEGSVSTNQAAVSKNPLVATCLSDKE